jgi:hypothetical protein
LDLKRTSKKKPVPCNRITSTHANLQACSAHPAKISSSRLQPATTHTLASQTPLLLLLLLLRPRSPPPTPHHPHKDLPPHCACPCLIIASQSSIAQLTPSIRTRANLFMVRPAVESLFAAPIPKATTATSTIPPPATLHHHFAAVLSYPIIPSQDESPRGSSSSCRSSCPSDLRPPYVRQAILRNCCSHGNDPPSNVNAANLAPLLRVY